MTIKYTLGAGLDAGTTYTHQPKLGDIVGGPRAFLDWLEVQMGLQRPSATFTARAMAYRSCLKQCANPDQFFYESFLVDPLGVAKTLLQWRDTWYLAGWGGGALGEKGDRLASLAEIESLAAASVPLGEGQRVAAVIDLLDQVEISLNLTCLDPIEYYPHIWQALLQKLGASFIEPVYSFADSGSDLGRIQRALANEDTGAKISLANDGSFLVVKAPSRALSAEWFAQAYAELSGATDEASAGVFIEGGSADLDAALETRGLPTLSVSGYSPARPVMQVLPLAMELIWAPLDPSRLLEFLAHSIAPVPNSLRRRLAEAVADQPGIGGEAWKEAIATSLKRAKDLSENLDEFERRQRDINESISFWLECEKYPPYPGASLSAVKQRVTAVSDWLTSQIAQISSKPGDQEDIGIYFRALSQARELLSAVDDLSGQGESLIDVDALRRLIHSVRSEGARRPDISPQIALGKAPFHVITSAVACVRSVNRLVWYGADTASGLKRYPWSSLEQKALKLGGVFLQSLDTLSAQMADSWLRPIYSARHQLIMVVHSNAETHHPVFDRLRSLIESLPEVDLLSHMQGAANPLLDSISTYTASEYLPLPSKSRVWRLPKDMSIPLREEESFSSLESFIYGPYVWVLKYAARIRKGKILAVNDENMLKGTLAHKVFEDYFEQFPDIPKASIRDAQRWAEDRIRQLLPEQGAVLLKSGRAPERERFISDTVAALANLLKHLAAAKVVSVDMETALKGRFVGGPLGGQLDLLARSESGREAIVDIKWGGTKYRQEALENSKYLQLATYWALHRQSGGSVPAVGYFTITQSELLVLNDDFFPTAKVIQPVNGETVQEFWARFEHSWKQRRTQLDNGLVEVNIPGTEPMEELLFDEKALPSQAIFEPFGKEFDAILGWGDKA